MANPRPNRILRAPGKLYVGPTDLSAAAPYGGVRVGSTRAVVLVNFGRSVPVPCEGLSGEASDILEGPSNYVFSCFLRGWDDDALSEMFGRNTSTSLTSHPVLEEPGSAVGGASAIGRAVKLLYVPDDPIAAPSMILYRVVVDIADGGEIAWQRRDELGIPIVGQCMRDDSGDGDRILKVGRLVDLTV